MACLTRFAVSRCSRTVVSVLWSVGELVRPLRLFPRVLERVEDVLVILPRLDAGRGDNDLRMCTAGAAATAAAALMRSVLFIFLWVKRWQRQSFVDGDGDVPRDGLYRARSDRAEW